MKVIFLMIFELFLTDQQFGIGLRRTESDYSSYCSSGESVLRVCVWGGEKKEEERQAEIATQESSSIPLLFSPDGAFHSVWGD